MSGVYFTVDDATKLPLEYIDESEPAPAPINKRDGISSSNEKLQDIEVQLELAENRCNSLKGQLDLMKNLYEPNTKGTKIRKFSNAQKSQVIKDKELGSSKTISNSHIATIEITKENDPCFIPDANILVNVDSVPKKQSRIDTGLKKFCSQHVGLKKDLKVRSSSVLNRRRLTRSYRSNYSMNRKLVELYHNDMATSKGSESDDSVKVTKNLKPFRLNLSDHTESWSKGDLNKPKPSIYNNISNLKSVSKTQNQIPSKNALDAESSYQMPTIASKLKQVARCYFNAFKFRAIPFCPATSTSPSHNIGINLQQVMSMMKMRQPFQGLSPTLAHNITLAAEKLNSSPTATMVTSMTSRTTCTYLRGKSCPVGKTRLNYTQLQEMAKAIPEEDVIMEGDEDSRETPVRTTIITGPSGDLEVKNRNDPVWAMDQECGKKCTCVNNSGPDLQYLVNKYRVGTGFSSTPSCSQQKKPKTNFIKKNKFIKTPLPTKKVLMDYDNKDDISMNNGSCSVDGKEKTLRGVLANLHREFETMNKRYEELSKDPDNANEEMIKEMEKLDNDLNAKEAEITTVMDLYKEVLALKQQIKSLKQKMSDGNISHTASRLAEYTNPKAAFHLTKLLKQIQLYQSQYKRDPRKLFK
ncbi:uncharacterized protein LOC109609007 isoform X2 [Aethina tumida]|uniref:uncharacterized protein LOC109609007 isoform X2 n=1 Tax=Aethina tumida TaxID=116153 RepID=UPI002147FA1C|nr:uncharacterized protein LOC109609007 isoform X2 [Aethina tumida]